MARARKTVMHQDADRVDRLACALGLAIALAIALASGAPLAAELASVGPVLTVAVRDVPQQIAAEGVVEAVRQATLGAQIAGRIVELGVKAGDDVRAGQVLARIDASTADPAVAASRSQIAEASANLANAKRKFERNRDLFERKFVSQAALEQAEAEYKAAQAQLATMQANAEQALAARSLTAIVAPYAGVVGATHAELGDMAQPGRTIVTVFDPRALRVTATVPQAALARLDLRAPVTIEVPAVDGALASTHATVIPLADARTHTSRIRLDLPPAAGLLPGQFARARFAAGSIRVLAVPQSALVRRGEVTAVYVIDAGGRAQLRQVRVGETAGSGLVEVLSGVAAGETVAADPVRAGMSAVASSR
jgi:RND family efflux transporter MFP subunit